MCSSWMIELMGLGLFEISAIWSLKTSHTTSTTATEWIGWCRRWRRPHCNLADNHLITFLQSFQHLCVYTITDASFDLDRFRHLPFAILILGKHINRANW